MSERVLNRRSALQAIGLAGAGVLAGPALLAGDAGAQQGKSAAEKVVPVPAAAREGDDKEPSVEAKRLGEIAKARYGQHLNEEQLRQLVEDLDRGLNAGQRLRGLRLKNSDEPDFVFRAEL
jgi:hypothetical protein